MANRAVNNGTVAISRLAEPAVVVRSLALRARW
jgi:hypothetical protein